jgi:erythronate-4-phosphate dehydrogenase
VRDADAIVIRSVTRVDRALLEGSRVRFVGTATIGTDHVDAGWLASRGIGFASAPGCNANAVSEYVVAALLELAARRGTRIRGSSIGVVGAGNVGSRVARKAAALGMTVLLNDPPLARSTGSPLFRPIDELMACDVVTLHVPLTTTGPDATRHLFGAGRIGAMKPGACLLNTARGAVVDTPALSGALRAGRLGAAVVDVWEGEPSVDPELLSLAGIATAHVAGYSLDAKARASSMMAEALAKHFGWDGVSFAGDALPPPGVPVIAPGPSADPEESVRSVVRTAYPVLRDDAALRAVSALPPGERPGHFLRLRNEYPPRREFPATTVQRDGSADFPERELAGLGFRIG